MYLTRIMNVNRACRSFVRGLGGGGARTERSAGRKRVLSDKRLSSVTPCPGGIQLFAERPERLGQSPAPCFRTSCERISEERERETVEGRKYLSTPGEDERSLGSDSGGEQLTAM